jgi:hypothetical protein
MAGPQPRPALLTLGQVAEMLGTSKAWVCDHATRRNPRIPCWTVRHEARNCPKRNEVAVNV